MDAYLSMKTITGLSGSDYNMNMQRPGSFAPGQVVFLHAETGLVVLVLIQNRGGSKLNQSDLARKLASASLVDITAGSDPRLEFTDPGNNLDVNHHIGSFAYVSGQGGAAPSGEYGIVVANTAVAVVLDPGRPLSADLVNNDDISLYPVYQARISGEDRDRSETILGVVIGLDGIDDDNFGFAQCFGVCPIMKHDGTAIATTGTALQSSNTDGAVESGAGADAGDVIGISLSTAPNTDADTFIGQIACGPMAGAVSRAAP